MQIMQSRSDSNIPDLKDIKTDVVETDEENIELDEENIELNEENIELNEENIELILKAEREAENIELILKAEREADDNTDETTEFLPKEKSENNNDFVSWYNDLSWSKVANLLTKAGLATVAGCSIMLYVDPAKKCAHLAGCGENVPGSEILGVIGGSEYAAVNVALGTDALAPLKEAFSIPESLMGKIAMGGWLLVFSSGSVCHIMFVSSATTSDPLKILMAAVGAIPASVYGASKLTTIEFRQFFSAVYNRFLMPNPDTVLDQYLPPEVDLLFKRYQYYSQQFAIFKTELNEKYHHFITSLSQAELRGEAHPLAVLHAQTVTSQDTSWIANAIGHLLATASTTAASIPLFLTTEEFVEKMTGVENEWLKALLSISINAPLIYSNFKMNDLVITAATNFLDSVLRCKPVNSLLWQLGKAKTLAAVAASTVISAYSYVVIGVVWRHLFPEDKETIMKIEAYASKAGIDMYHLGGTMKLIEMAWKFFTKDEKAKIAFAVKEEFEKFNNYTLEQFIEFCDKDENRKEFDLSSYDEHEAKISIEQVEAPSVEEPAHPSDTVPKNYSQRGLFSRLCCFDNAPTPGSTPELPRASAPSLRGNSEDT